MMVFNKLTSTPSLIYKPSPYSPALLLAIVRFVKSTTDVFLIYAPPPELEILSAIKEKDI